MAKRIRDLQRAAQRPDTAADVLDRRRRQLAATRAVADRQAKYPELSADNAQAALDYQEARYQEHYRTLSEG
jgi:uncharacterized protein (DUF433 family)